MTRLILLAALLVNFMPVPAVDAAEPMDTCFMCHEDIESSFALSAHTRAMFRANQAIVETSCATCHQTTDEHFDEQAKGSVTRQPADDACLTCHKDRHSTLALMTPAHVRNGVSCIDCHDMGHYFEDQDAQNAPAENPSVASACVACHQSEAAAFRMPYAHRELGKPFECTTCHTAHGEGRKGRLIMIERGGACIGCHVEKHQPYVFPHPPANRNGCVACHQPHGSPNPRQLTRHNPMMLCLECHVDVPSFHDVSSTRYRNCTQCHSAIHGSNRDSKLFEE